MLNFIGRSVISRHNKLFALYQGTTSVVPPPAKMVGAFRVCVRT
jgi:hypothetical protein